jgi:hypothetical protein
VYLEVAASSDLEIDRRNHHHLVAAVMEMVEMVMAMAVHQRDIRVYPRKKLKTS